MPKEMLSEQVIADIRKSLDGQPNRDAVTFSRHFALRIVEHLEDKRDAEVFCAKCKCGVRRDSITCQPCSET